MLESMQNCTSCYVPDIHFGSQWALIASIVSLPGVVNTLRLRAPMPSPAIFQPKSSAYVSIRSTNLMMSFESPEYFSLVGSPDVALRYVFSPPW